MAALSGVVLDLKQRLAVSEEAVKAAAGAAAASRERQSERLARCEARVDEVESRPHQLRMLRQAGFDAKQLRRGFTSGELYGAGFGLHELRLAGFEVRDLARTKGDRRRNDDDDDGDDDDGDLDDDAYIDGEAGSNRREDGAAAEDVDEDGAGVNASVEELRAVGFSASELRRSGCFRLEELKGERRERLMVCLKILMKSGCCLLLRSVSLSSILTLSDSPNTTNNKFHSGISRGIHRAGAEASGVLPGGVARPARSGGPVVAVLRSLHRARVAGRGHVTSAAVGGRLQHRGAPPRRVRGRPVAGAGGRHAIRGLQPARRATS